MECRCAWPYNRHVVHDGDCPLRCTWWRRSSVSEAVAQCDRWHDHDGDHLPNLYRGSPSARAERGLRWPIPDPQCDEPATLGPWRCGYYYLDPDNHCTLQMGHREHHKLVSGVSNAEGVEP